MGKAAAPASSNVGPEVARKRGRPRISPHPTALLLLNTAVEILDTVSVDRLTIAAVLERSGVAYGSLYHHYEDFSDLVEQAVVERYSRRVKVSIELVRSLLTSRDAADFRERSEALFRESFSPDRHPNRLERAEALGSLKGRPRLQERLAAVQQELTDSQAEVLGEAQSRGWVRPDVDVVAVSALIQAVVLGRIVDDVSAHPVGREAWNAVAMRAVSAVLFPD